MLNHLISELFREVISHLDPADLPALRLVSRQVERQTRASFAAAFFSTLKLDFSEPNLQWLTNIASHPSFRHAVQGIKLARWAPNWGRDEEFALGYGGHWPRLRDGPVDPSSELAQQFVSAVRRLPSCTRVSIMDVNVQRGPVRDGMDIFGFGLEPAHHLSTLDALELSLHAYSLPGAAPLRDLRIRVINWRHWPARKALAPSTIDAVLPSWAAHAESLFLEFMADYEGMPLLLRLLTGATGLRSLRLTWAAPEDDTPTIFGLNGGFWRDTDGSMLSRHLEEHQGSPLLETLAIRGITIGEADLLALLSRCRRTLTNLAFSSMGLSAGTWISVLRRLRSSRFPDLRNLSMYVCTQKDNYGAMVFCNLFQCRDALEPSGGSFDFATGTSFDIKRHVMGVRFQSSQGAATFEAGLHAIIDKCRVAAFGEGWGRCEMLAGVPKLPANTPEGPLAARRWWVTTGERDPGLAGWDDTGVSPPEPVQGSRIARPLETLR